MVSRSRSLMAGVPELTILRVLAEREMYGYELARAIRVLSGETLSLGEGVLYPALHVLEARQLLRSRTARVAGRVRVYYSLAARGRKRLAALTEEWRRISGGVAAVLGNPDHG
jgi:PadR family transcriptional regulator, regulatory protein PadR